MIKYLNKINIYFYFFILFLSFFIFNYNNIHIEPIDEKIVDTILKGASLNYDPHLNYRHWELQRISSSDTSLY